MLVITWRIRWNRVSFLRVPPNGRFSFSYSIMKKGLFVSDFCLSTFLRRCARGRRAVLLSASAGAIVAASPAIAMAVQHNNVPTPGPTVAVTKSAGHAVVACNRGAACLWEGREYAGSLHTWDLRSANPGDCIALDTKHAVESLGNRMDRDLVIYRQADCATGSDKQTYPGGGTYSARTPFPVAAIKIGE